MTTHQKNSSSDEFLLGTGEGDILPLLSDEPFLGNTLGFLAVDGTLKKGLLLV